MTSHESPAPGGGGVLLNLRLITPTPPENSGYGPRLGVAIEFEGEAIEGEAIAH